MLIDCLGTTEQFATVFSDRSVLEAMLQFEAALARSQARLGMIPQTAADAICAVRTDKFAPTAIAREARDSASVAIPFVQALRRETGNDFVHWGATSQDVIDTALILLLAQARVLLQHDHERLSIAMRRLSTEHKSTLMLARTLMQPASVTTFGYKVALWYGGVSRSWRRLSESFDRGLLLQFGGASGTLAAYGDHGPMLARELSEELNLPVAPPWHTQRDRLAAIVADLGIYAGSLGKMAGDIILMMQFEVGELSETGGGSSAMPHKHNPSGSTVALAGCARIPELVAAYLGALVQEHERASGAWQSEWQTVAEIVCATGSVLTALCRVFETLEVSPQRMRQNLDSTYGTALSEKAALLLAAESGRAAAQEKVRKAVATAYQLERPLSEILNMNLGGPEDYLGSSEMFRRQLLEDVE